MSNESPERAAITPDAVAASTMLQPHDWQKLTPLDLLRFARQWSIKSWLFVIGVAAALSFGSWSAGSAYQSGQLPEIAYALEDPGRSPLSRRLRLEREEQFANNYGELVDWQKLRPVARGIAEDRPDGLVSEFEIAASLLAQIRATRGEARFLAGTTEHIVRLTPAEGTLELEWEQGQSIVPGIARDAGYELTEDELKIANTNLNWAQFTYLDDAMEHAVIYRDLDGALNLTISQQ